MRLMEEPDYSSYSLEELHDAKAHVNSEKYPETFNRIVEMIETKSKRMAECKSLKIRLPIIVESGLGLVLTSRLTGLFKKTEYFVINNNSLTHTGNKKTYSLQNIKSILIETKEIIPLTKSNKFDFFACSGTKTSLFLKGENELKIQILPPFVLGHTKSGIKDWARFLTELSEKLKLKVEHETMRETIYS